jgi:serine/threonine-protein kinase
MEQHMAQIATVDPRGATGQDKGRTAAARESAARLAAIEREEHPGNLSRSGVVWAAGAAATVLVTIAEISFGAAHEAALAAFLGPRAALVAVLAGAAAWSRRDPPMSISTLRALDAGVYAAAASMIALMTAPGGGLGSPLVHGAACLAVAQGIALPDHFRRGAVRLFASLSAFVATLVCAAAWVSPPLAAQVRHPSSVPGLAAHAGALLVLSALALAASHAMWSARRALVTKRTVGKYALEERIGRGGMGEVWRARSPGQPRDVAVKLLRSDVMTPQTIARFGREVAALAELRHPNTVRVHDWGALDGTFYYAMELLSGRTLRELVARSGPLPPERAAHIARQAARALAEAHGRGIVHRDIKPDNLFLTGHAPDFVKLLDFGVARSIEPAARESSITRIGMIIGTAAYMAPEQVLTAPVDARTDVYALGAVLFYMLTGRPPFLGTEQDVIRAQLRAEPPDVATFSPHRVSAALRAVIRRCLEKQQRRRYASMLDLDLALARALAAPDLVEPREPEEDHATTAPDRPAAPRELEETSARLRLDRTPRPSSSARAR